MSTVEFVGDENGNLKGIKICEVDWSKPDDNGAPFTLVEGSEQELECDLVFLALGFLGPEHIISEQLDLELDGRTNFKAEHEQYTTSLEGVFAARECDRYLMGATELP